MASREASPWEKAGFLSKLTFSWLIPLLRKGRQKDLQEDDLYDCTKNDTSEVLGDALQKEWSKELERCKKGKKPSLTRAVVRTFGLSYFLISLLPCIEECFLKVYQPLLLGMLIHAYHLNPTEERARIYWSAAGVCIASFLCQFTRHPYFFLVRRVGMRIRIACCTLVYKKAIRLCKAALGETTVGQMVNLVSNDVNRFDQSVVYLPYIVVGPLQMAITVAVLWEDLGPSCLTGVSVILLYIPFQAAMGKVFAKMRTKIAVVTDLRIRVMSELIAAMKIIKMYTWESPFQTVIEECRTNEVKSLRWTSLLQGINYAITLVFSKVVLAVCFACYVFLGNNLNSEIVFVALTLYNNLRLSMAFCFSNAVIQTAETRVSLGRLEKFLLLDEQEEDDSDKILEAAPEKCGVWMKDATARWNWEFGDVTLNRISLEVKHGELLAIVGSVGSSKSSVLMALLRELQLTSGHLRTVGKLAYTSQEPWTFSGTVRQNIIFGNEFDPYKYKRVLVACALDKDITQFPNGDMTPVGEKGVSLSGGQRARVNLARSLYADADIYLLDDPLSAVDTAVAKHLFENCINGYLKDKVRILVTHQIQFLKAADKILVMNQGKCEAMGTYDSLVNSGINIVAILEDAEEARERRKSMVVKASAIASTRRKSIAPMTTLAEGRRASRIVDVRKRSIFSGGSQTSVRKKSVFFGEQSSMRKKSVSFILDQHRQSVASIYSIDEESAPSGVMRTEISPYGAIFDPSSVDEIFQVEENEDACKPVEESKSTGSLDLRVYAQYLLAGANCIYLLILATFILLTQAVSNGSDYWLSIWMVAEENRTSHGPDATNATDLQMFLQPFADNLPNFYLFVYIFMIVVMLLLSLVRSVAFSFLAVRASRILHNRMFGRLIKTQIGFFDSNPVGRILNRFTKDLGAIDDQLPVTFFDMVSLQLTLLGNIVLVVMVNYYVAVPTVALGLIFVLLRGFFLNTTRDVKRLEGTTRSPVFSHLATSLYGLTTIRAFGKQTMFEKEFCHHQDHHTSCWFLFISASQYFGMVLDVFCALFIAIVTLTLILLSDAIPGSNIGLAISSALMLSGTFQWGVRQSAEVENQMTSVERVLEYCQLPTEADYKSRAGKGPPDTWPDQGEIQFDKVNLYYAPDKPPVLKNLTCKMRPREKVGIVGRTGAGKSSLISALFRMSEPEGNVYIDGIATKNIGLYDLRSKVSIIPQEPVIFTGSVRANLDPFETFNDMELWSALEQVQLKETVQNLPGGLFAELSEGGGNLSVGQRQLFCLARTLIKKNRILIMDEATANIDNKTDALIQRLIRENFRHCTVLTVAHRLNTIIDSDRILVLDAGSVAEFDDPHTLINSHKIFYDMVKKTGPAMAKQLRDSAARAFRMSRTRPPETRQSTTLTEEQEEDVPSDDEKTTKL